MRELSEASDDSIFASGEKHHTSRDKVARHVIRNVSSEANVVDGGGNI